MNIPFEDIAHKFTNKTQLVAHILCLLTPAGMEKMFEELGEILLISWSQMGFR